MLGATWFVAAQQAQQRPNLLVQMLPILAILVIFYFLLIRPKQKEQKQHQQMLLTLTKGDRVLTSGGIFATVVAVKDDRVVLKVADNVKEPVKIELLKTAVMRKLGRDEGEE
jgi:preprotein translocase subunit YajC